MNRSFLEQGKINKALVALDLSDMDLQMLEYLSFLRKKIPIEKMIFLHVQPVFDVYSSTYFPAFQAPEETNQPDEAIDKSLREKIDGVFGPDTAPLEIEVVTRSGNVLETILAQEAEWQADLVVIGDKNADATTGVLKRNIVRKSKAPVLLIPKGAENELSWTLVPIDFSENSARALAAALNVCTIASPTSGITSLHVYEQPPVHPYMVTAPGEIAPNLVKTSINNAAKKFISKAQAKASALIAVENLVEEKPVSQRIPDCIFAVAEKRAKPGLIIVGAKGHSRLERLLIGSVTERLISKDQKLPVLIIR